MEKKVLIGVSMAGNCYNAHAPDFPGCLATGKTADEARQKLVSLLALHIKGMIEDGEYIPEGDEFYSVASIPLPGVDKAKINGDYLKSYRRKLGLTQSELADKLEVTKETVSEWERGRRELPGTVKFALEAVV